MASMQRDGATSTAAAVEMSVSAAEADKLKRKRQPRNSACQGCASLKMKCIATPTLGICERCHRMSRECIPAVPKPRKRRATDQSNNTPESKGIPLSDLVDHNDSPDTPYRPTPRPFLSTETRNGDYATVSQASLLSKVDLSHNDSSSFATLLAQGLGIEENSSRQLLRGVDYNLVQNSFTVFRQMLAHFPFVELSPAADAIFMVSHRPVLTTAICTVAAAAYPELQDRLSRAFRQALCSRCIMEGEKSLDLMSGLLVYLAWHHHYMAKQQVHQELHLLAGMAIDLGIYTNHPLSSTPNPEAQRAFLGCYYLCTGLSVMGFYKPSPLHWSPDLSIYAENLGCSHMIELVVALGDLDTTLRDMPETPSTFLQASFSDLAINKASQHLQSIRRLQPSGHTSPDPLTAAQIHLYARQILPRSALSQRPADTTTKMQAAVTIKDYLDDILSRPPSNLHVIPILSWTNLLEVLVLMSHIARPSSSSNQNAASATNSAGWEAGALQSMLQPEALLDALVAHISSAPGSDPLAPRCEALVQEFRTVCERIRRRLGFERSGGGGGGEGPSNEAEGRFRPVNAAVMVASSSAFGGGDGRGDMGSAGTGITGISGATMGVLDEGFWKAFMS